MDVHDGRLHSRRDVLKAGAALLALSAGPAFSQDAGTPHRFLCMASLTGPGTTYGKAFAAGVQTAIAQINAAKFLDRPVEAIVLDTGTDPAKAAVAFQDEVSSARPSAVFLGVSTAEVLALAPFASREKLLFITSSDHPSLTDAGKNRYLFGIASTFQAVSEIQAQQLKSGGVKTVGLMTALDGTGEIMTTVMPSTLKKNGIEVLGIERFKPTDVDMTSQLRKLDSLNPDILYIEGSGAPTGYILQGLVRLAIKRPVVCGKAMAASNLESLIDVSQFAGPVYIWNHAAAHRGASGRGGLPVVTKALPDLKAASGGKLLTSLYIYSWAYDAPYIWATAVRDAKSSEPDVLVSTLESWSSKLPTGVDFMFRDNYPYSATEHLPPAVATAFSFGRIGTLDENGTRESIEFKVG